MKVIKPIKEGALIVCLCCNSILNFIGTDVIVEEKKFFPDTRYIICPICKRKIELS